MSPWPSDERLAQSGADEEQEEEKWSETRPEGAERVMRMMSIGRDSRQKT